MVALNGFAAKTLFPMMIDPPEGKAPSAASPRLAVVTVTYNSRDVLADFLDSLDRQRAGDWVLVAVDNASSDGTIEILKHWGGPLHIIANDANIGFAAGSNIGIEWARANGYDAVLLLNNDTVFDHDFLNGLFEVRKATGARILAPVVQSAADPGHNWYADGKFSWRRGYFEALKLERAKPAPSWEAEFAPGCALFIDMDVFEQIGMLDELFFVYWEDVDFCLRCQAGGISVLVTAQPTLAHKASSLTGATSAFSADMFQRNQILLMRKHFGTLVTSLSVLPILTKILARLALRRDSLAMTRVRLRAVAEAALGPSRPGRAQTSDTVPRTTRQ